VPASKSLLHRGLFCAALAGDLSLCPLPPDDELSDDIRATLACAKQLNVRNSQLTFDCHESGTTLRLLIPILAALGIPARITGSGRLPQRPLSEYIDAFAPHGATLSAISHQPSAFAEISGTLSHGNFNIRGDISSQYISGLMLALPLLDGDSRIVLTTPLESKPYVDMTLDVMRHFGVEGGFEIRGRQRYSATTPYTAEPDYSQAAFWLLAAHIGNAVAVSGLCHGTSQGDAVYRDLLGKPEADVSDCPDLLPALAGAAAFAPHPTRFTNAARLRLKESDRLESTRAMLAAFGVGCEITADSMTVFPNLASHSNAATITVDGANDHRIVMTAAMLATRASSPVTILGADAVNKSYPHFFRDFAAVGGQFYVS